MGLVKPGSLGGGGFFKPAEHANDVAIVVEPKTLQRDVPDTYQGVTKLVNVMVADVFFFPSLESLENGTPDVVLGMTIKHKGVTNKLEHAVGTGDGVPGRVEKSNPPGGGASFWNFVKLGDASMALVEKWYEAREAAAADAPPFD